MKELLPIGLLISIIFISGCIENQSENLLNQFDEYEVEGGNLALDVLRPYHEFFNITTAFYIDYVLDPDEISSINSKVNEFVITSNLYKNHLLDYKTFLETNREELEGPEVNVRVSPSLTNINSDFEGLKFLITDMIRDLNFLSEQSQSYKESLQPSIDALTNLRGSL